MTKRYIYIMGHQRNIKGYIKGTSRGTSILILFNNTLYKYNNTIAYMKGISCCLKEFFVHFFTTKTNNNQPKNVPGEIARKIKNSIPVSVAGVPGSVSAPGVGPAFPIPLSFLNLIYSLKL